MKTVDKLRKAYIEHIKAIEPNFEITLCAGHSCTADVLEVAATKFLNRLQRKAHGRNWYKQPLSERVVAAGFFEHHDSNLHLHLAAQLPTAELQSAAADGQAIWRSLRPAGSYHASLIGEVANYARYITKQTWDRRTREQYFVYDTTDDSIAIEALRAVKSWRS